MPINISTSPTVYSWNPAAWLRVTGSDAATFLQGQFTNDLRALPTARAVYGLWLTLKGKVLADSFVLAGTEADEFWIGSYFSSAAVIRERLESHVIADEVVVEDQTELWAGVSVLGRDTDEAIPAPQTFVFRGRRAKECSWEYVYRVAAGTPRWLRSDDSGAMLRVSDDEEIARCRIRAGIPAIPRDVGLADLPHEAGLENEAVSFTKGCYLGQEVMARLKAMGQVRRRLMRVAGRDQSAPATPAPVFVGGRQVGELRSAVRDEQDGWIGLAMLSLLHVHTDTELAFASNGPAALRLLDVP